MKKKIMKKSKQKFGARISEMSDPGVIFFKFGRHSSLI